MQQLNKQDIWKQNAAHEALDLVQNQMILGLGTGSTAAFFIQGLAQKVHSGLKVLCVPTSKGTESLARRLEIPLTTLDDHPELDLAVDGADEITSDLTLIKGGGGALLREKVVASAAKRFVVIADATKKVQVLGNKCPLPVEIIPFALEPVRRKLSHLGAEIVIRGKSGKVFYTDNNNIILDCSFSNGIDDPWHLESQIKDIPGVVETGLFIDMTEKVIISGPDGTQSITRKEID